MSALRGNQENSVESKRTVQKVMLAAWSMAANIK